MWLILVKRAETARGRAARGLNFDDVGTEVTKNLPAEQSSLSRKIKNSISTQHELPPLPNDVKGRKGTHVPAFLPVHVVLSVAQNTSLGSPSPFQG
jgi:hypothetical protein